MKRIHAIFVALLLTLAVMPGRLMAQYSSGDSGEYVILTAQYGTERRHVDVTDRLKELARQDRIFQMGNGTFGVDPDPGRTKTLRIYARGNDGQERMFEYREGTTVDGSQFRGWGRGDWGQGGWSGRWEIGGNNGGYQGNDNGYRRDNHDEGEYVILTAQYGTDRRHVDVTDRLKELARQDRVFQMGNGTFGVDPDPGRNKTLRIYARGNDGQERMFEYREGTAVDGSQFRGWGRGDWGHGGWSGRWELGDRRADNGGYQGDQNGYRRDNDGRDSGEFVILSAQYGTKRRHVDVTDRLKEVARQDQVVVVENRMFGVDPDRNHTKVLRIYARGRDRRERMFEYREGTAIDGSQFRSWNRGEWGNERWSGRWEGQRQR